jgi:hypothetical protein
MKLLKAVWAMLYKKEPINGEFILHLNDLLKQFISVANEGGRLVIEATVNPEGKLLVDSRVETPVPVVKKATVKKPAPKQK